MFIDIDYTKKKPKPALSLAAPNKRVLSLVPEAYNIQQNMRLGNISELSFEIPIELDQRNKLHRNKNADLIKERFLIKFEIMSGASPYKEWYLIDKVSKNMDSDSEYLAIHCFSLGYELSDKFLKNYSVVSKNATQLLSDALSSTIWTVDYMDASFDMKYRAFDVSTMSVLDFVQEVAEKFNALLVWNTENRTISFYNPENYSQNRFFHIRYGKLLESIEVEQTTEEFCTRLRVFGRDGLSINSVNPTGTNYIENYSHFLKGFQRDESREVHSHSEYHLSDALCHALLDYQELVESKRGDFQELLADLSSLQSTLTNRGNELQQLQAELSTIEAQLSIANATGQSTSTWITQKNNKLTQIHAKQTEVDTAQTNVNLKQHEIDILKSEVSIETNFTEEQLTEWNPLIIEREWINDHVTEAQELYEAALVEFEKRREPKIVAKVDMVNLLEIMEEQKNWNKLNIGDVVRIEHEKLGIHIQAKMIEFNFDYESGDISITIANEKELLDDKERFLRDLYKSISTSTTFDQNKFKYDSAKSTADEVSQLLDHTWNAIDRAIVASTNETVEISGKGIRTYDVTDPLKMSIMQHGVIGVSSDGGNTWRNAITWEGVVAERLVGQIIAGNDLTITNAGGTFTVNETGVTISDLDLTQVSSNGKNRIIQNANDGFKIQKNTGTIASPVWADNLYADVNGDLILNDVDAKGTIRAQQLILNGVNVLTNGNSLIDGQYIDSITTDQIIAGNAKISTAMIENLVVGTNVTMGSSATISWNNVTSRPSIPTVPSYITSTKITSTTIESPSITGATIIGADIIGTSTITGALIRTASSGNRIELSNSGFVSLNSNNQKNGVVLDSGNFTTLGFYYLNGVRGTISQVANDFSVRAVQGTTSGGGTQLILESNFSNVIIRGGTGNGANYGKVIFEGDVDLSNANVDGIVAKFG